MNLFKRRSSGGMPESAQIQEVQERHNLAQQVFFRREALDLTQEALAARAGMTQAQIANLEAGHANPTHRTLVRIAAALGCGVGDLYVPRAEDKSEEGLEVARFDSAEALFEDLGI